MNRPDDEREDYFEDLKKRIKEETFPLTRSMKEYLIKLVEKDQKENANV